MLQIARSESGQLYSCFTPWPHRRATAAPGGRCRLDRARSVWTDLMHLSVGSRAKAGCRPLGASARLPSPVIGGETGCLPPAWTNVRGPSRLIFGTALRIQPIVGADGGRGRHQVVGGWETFGAAPRLKSPYRDGGRRLGVRLPSGFGPLLALRTHPINNRPFLMQPD